MAHRGRISADVVKFGPAGVDVLTASADQLLFDGSGSPYNGAYLVGRLLASGFAESVSTLSNGGKQYTRTATLNFGRTFPAAPRVIFGIIDPGGGAYTPNGYFNDTGMGIVSGISTGAALKLTCSISTTQAVFTITYVYYSGAGYTRTLDVPYIVFQV